MNQKNRSRQPKPLKDLTLLDRFLFDTAMEDPDICHNILSIIFDDREIPAIRIGIAERAIEPYYDARAVRLDLLAFDENDVVYDAEAQQKNQGTSFLCRRSRLYQAQVDVNLMQPGDVNFDELNDIYIIFIAPFDLFGLGRYKYTFRMRCDEDPNIVLEDGATRIFLNTRGTNQEGVSEELIEFLHFMEHTTEDTSQIKSSRVRQLASQVRQIKTDQKVGVKYMRLWEEIAYERMEAKEEGLEEGLEKGREEGLEKGREEGREEGLEKGREEYRKELAQMLLSDNKSLGEIVRYTQLPAENIREMADLLGLSINES